MFLKKKYETEVQAGDPGPRVVDFIAPYFMPADLPGMENFLILEDGSLGCVWRLGVPAVESVAHGHQRVAKALDLIIREVPPYHDLQLLPTRTTNIKRYVDHYLSGSSKAGISGLFAEGLAKRWLDARREGFFPETPEFNFFPIDQDLLLTLRSPPIEWFGSSKESWVKTLALMMGRDSVTQKLDVRVKRFGNAFRRACQGIEQAAASSGVGMYRLTPDELIEYVQKVYYPDRDLQYQAPRYTGMSSIAEVVGSLGGMELTDGGAITGNGRTHLRVVIMMSQPDGVEAGMLAEILNLGWNIQVFANIEMLDQTLAKLRLNTQKFFASRMVTNFTQMETQERISSMNDVMRRLYNGEKLIRVMFGAIVQGKSERDAEERAERVAAIMRRYMEAEPENTIGENIIFRSMPLGHTQATSSRLARSRRMLSRDLADCVPVGGSWEGITDKPLVMYASRWGTPLFINPQVCDSNPHWLVAGGSGSGKSFFVHYTIMQLWRLPDIRIYLISIKEDYRKLAERLGKYVVIDLDNPVSLNPFGGPPTKENQAFWVTVLVNMILEGAAGERVSKEEMVMLGESAIQASRENWDEASGKEKRETILSDIVSVLNASGNELGRSLAKRLSSYHSGQFSKLFNAPRGISHSDRFIFFNLGKLAGYSCQGVVLLSVFRFINDAMYDPAMRGVLKILGIDEVWNLLKDDHSSHFIETSFRAYRSLNGMAFAVSQLFSDYDSPVGRVLLANTATKYILRQEQSELRKLTEYIDLTDTELQLVASLNLKKRFYSEFFVKMQGFPSTVGRVVADPLAYAIATTDPSDETIYNGLLHQLGGDHARALDAFVKKYPYGRAVNG